MPCAALELSVWLPTPRPSVGDPPRCAGCPARDAAVTGPKNTHSRFPGKTGSRGRTGRLGGRWGGSVVSEGSENVI